MHLRRQHVRSLKQDYLRGAQAGTVESGDAMVAHTLKFYATLIASALVEDEAQMRMLLDEMRTCDLIEPTAPVYQSLLCSLLLVTREPGAVPTAAATPVEEKKESGADADGATAAAASPSPSSASTPAAMKVKADDLVVGEVKTLHRAQAGDMAGYYMGHALSHHRAGQCHYPASLLRDAAAGHTSAADAAGRAPPAVEYVSAELWGTFLSLCAVTHVAPKLMDLWWEKCLAFFDAERAAAKKRHLFAEDAELRADDENGREGDLAASFLADLVAADADAPTPDAATAAADRSPLPYGVVHAMLSWAAAQRDVERVMRYFQESNRRGLWLADGTAPPGCLTLPWAALRARYPSWVPQPGQRGGAPLTEATLQEVQLRLLAKLMAASKSMKMDGGLRDLVAKDVRQLIPLPVLQRAPWGVLSDLMTGLSVASTMQVLKLASASRPNGDGDVPFFVWAAILRRCAHEHCLDHAESLFRFIRARFTLDVREKRELVEIMMRMYGTLAPPDFSSTLAIFNDHVLRCPSGEPAVAPDAALYTLLIQAADSRDSAAMVFLEACGDGVVLDADLFEAVLGANQHNLMAKLSRKLPHEYGTSDLDAQLRIPHNVDAHARREEALQMRGKTFYNSTGETGY
ncbi:hypothetical protein STCU_05529 [Strigomonas culicis]|uniref:Uncharacterized protein n=1 Tax=Strigomonas culicis TaxID=28005 RepID=S9UGD4_9TRYP|nr:hypothetical protein STCU_05529 [Strigomonas culicis]|eukprot:EPY27809.1 hypothetical protein STCU_05529 [Strigomonas culicis]